jgi:hypothetical protein
MRRYSKKNLYSFEADAEQAPYDSEQDIWIACGCGVLSFVVYMSTLYPHVPGGDSGELIAAAYQLGVGHPPGYPLFCILEKILCSLLYCGSQVYSVYLLS